jgi:hypothetical protein
VAAIAVRSGVKQESCARFAVLQLQFTTGHRPRRTVARSGRVGVSVCS